MSMSLEKSSPVMNIDFIRCDCVIFHEALFSFVHVTLFLEYRSPRLLKSGALTFRGAPNPQESHVRTSDEFIAGLQ
jgi:hypothetical protein